MIDVEKFIKELRKWQISYSVDDCLHIQLSGGDKTARMHYQQILQENSLLEDLFVDELTKYDEKLKAKFEEANVGAFFYNLYH